MSRYTLDNLLYQKADQQGVKFIFSKVSEVSSYFNNTLIIKVDGSSAELPVSRSNVKEFKERLKI